MAKTICDVCGAPFPVAESFGPVIGLLVKANGEEELALCLDCLSGGLREAALLFREKEALKHDLQRP